MKIQLNIYINLLIAFLKLYPKLNFAWVSRHELKIHVFKKEEGNKFVWENN